MPASAQPTAPLRDILAGLGVSGLLLPEAIAYAQIAGVAPGRAILAGVAGGLAYAAIGRSRFATVAPTSSSAAILAAAVASLGVAGPAAGALVTGLTLCVAVIFAGFAVLRLGSLASFISRPVLRGFGFGLAITIVVRQLPKLAGIKAAHGSVWVVLGAVLGAASQWHWASIGLGLGALGLLLALRRVPQVPGALVVIAGGIALASFANLADYGIALAGPAPLTFDAFALPTDLKLWARLIQLAAPIALILFAESWGTIRNLALRHGDSVAPDRELIALACANVAAGAAQAMPVGAGFSVGSAMEAGGAGSRLAGATAAIALLALALGAGPLIARIPEPVLAAVVIAALTHALSPAPLVRLFRLGRDQWVALAALAGVLALGVLDGMLAAVALSIAMLLYDMAHPSISELGRVGQSHDFVDLVRHPEAARVPGLSIFRPNAPLFFANAEATLGAIAARASAAPKLVLSLEESNDLDSTALDALGEFAASLGKHGIDVRLARVHDSARAGLTLAGLEHLASDATYSVADATVEA